MAYGLLGILGLLVYLVQNDCQRLECLLIVGADRDSYYDVFGADNAAIAITPLTDLRTVNIPTTGLGTDPGQDVTSSVGSRRSSKLTYQDTTGDRQLHAYEFGLTSRNRTH